MNKAFKKKLQEELTTTRGAARILGTTSQNIRGKLDAKILDGVQIENIWFIAKSDLKTVRLRHHEPQKPADSLHAAEDR
jgi:hypothetical protein